MTRVFGPSLALALVAIACVPPGRTDKQEPAPTAAPARTAAPVQAFRPSTNIMTAVFEDTFDRMSPQGDVGGKTVAMIPAETPLLGSEWEPAGTDVWHIENGMLCGEGAHNHGIWLAKTLPINARIEFDAVSYSPDGDLKVELWGDGRSSAHGVSYTDATSYETIFGGWKNSLNVLARLNEHGRDRKEMRLDPNSPDTRLHPVVPGQKYHFKVERTDGRSVNWSIDGAPLLTFYDPLPLAGMGHDHFAFNDWEAKVCFDNVKITPLP